MNDREGSALEADRPQFRKVACVACGGERFVPIVFGYPLPETFEAAERGEVVLGGCIVSDDDPKVACAACGEPLPRTRRTRAAARKGDAT